MHFNLWWNCTCKWKMEILHPMNFFSPFIFQPVEKQEKLCALNLQRDSRAQKSRASETSFSHWCASRRSHDYYVLFLGFSHLSWTMSLLTNEEKERIKGLRCHAEVTKKVKEGKRPVAEHRWWRTFWPSLALVCCSTKSLSSLKRKPPGDKVTKFFLCPFPKTEGAKRTEEKSRRANQ